MEKEGGEPLAGMPEPSDRPARVIRLVSAVHYIKLAPYAVKRKKRGQSGHTARTYVLITYVHIIVECAIEL